MVLLQLEDPLELFVKRREFLPGSRFLKLNNINTLKLFVKRREFLPGSGFLSRHNMTYSANI